MATTMAFLIPPRRVKVTGGRWRIPKAVMIGSACEADRLGLDKTADLLAKNGVRAAGGDAGRAAIRVRRSRRIGDGEGYSLKVTPQGAVVEAATDAGAFYGLATLRELIRNHGTSIPCCAITDAPRFRRRGVYHDCARGKVPKLATLMGLVERLAEWKINELQLYVENAFKFESHPLIWRGYSPLTPSEIVRLREHCGKHHIRLVPSLSSFGHMEKVLRLPQYAHLNEVPNGSTLCPTDPGSIRFIEELYGEFLPLFDAADFNVCCDETWDLGRGRTHAQCRRLGAGRVYLQFLKKIRRLCRKFGRRMNAWSDIVLKHPELLAELPRDIVMLNWGYEADSERLKRTGEIARAGLPLMVCPGTSSWGTIGSRWPNAHGNIRLAATEGKRHGAEGILNTDWGDRGHRQFLAVSLMAMAFGGAESWNAGAADPAAFPRRFGLQTFADDTGALGDAIEALGCTYLRHENIQRNCDPMTFNLEEPLKPTTNALWYSLRRTVDRFRPEALAATLASLPDASVWKRRMTDSFDAACMAEYALTGRIVDLYCRRSGVAWKMGMGQRVTGAAFRRLADRIDRVGAGFSELWLRRNKPSRLRDTVRLFRNAAAEARKLSDG